QPRSAAAHQPSRGGPRAPPRGSPRLRALPPRPHPLPQRLRGQRSRGALGPLPLPALRSRLPPGRRLVAAGAHRKPRLLAEPAVRVVGQPTAAAALSATALVLLLGALVF